MIDSNARKSKLVLPSSTRKENEVANMPEGTGQKWQASWRNGRTEQSAINCRRKTSKQLVDVDKCQKPHYRVKIRVDNKEIAAVVDTAAELTIISEDVFNAMKVRPRKVKM